jgi:hypothetical protein
MQIKVIMQVTRTLQPLVFIMKIIYLAGVLQTVYIIVFTASLQCVVCHTGVNWILLFHIGQVFLSFESSFSVQVKHLPLRLSRQCVPFSLYYQIFSFSQNWHNRQYCSNRVSKIIQCQQIDHEGTMFSNYRTSTLSVPLYWSHNYWRRQFNKYNGMNLLKVRSLGQFEVLQLA